MSLFHRKALTAVGFTAAAVASTSLFVMPAQAASAGTAKVVGSATVQFNALMGKSNGLTVTISGRTVTLNDKVAIKAGKGCKAVKGDKTKVKCTTKKKTTKISVALGDKTDWVTNKTSVYMLADGGSGTDTLTGGKGKDQLQGGTGNDKLKGMRGADTLLGGSGNDIITGSNGSDRIDAGSGADDVSGGSGSDTIEGGSGVDTINGDSGIDHIYGDSGNDVILGGSGADFIYGGAGNDAIAAWAGDDFVSGDAGNDSITGGVDDDILVGLAGNDTIAGNAGDDILVGEDIDDSGQIGSDSALDKLDGGANLADGDGCLVMAAGTTVNCEYGTVTSLGHTSAAARVLQAKARATAARPTR